jgi:DNA-binding transcriptional LysR family regulator
MELRHLRYFLAVAEHQGFRKAAQALRVSHPSLCEQIIDLEGEIGTRLFERTNHHVSLTAAGTTFVAGARRTLKSAHQAVEAAQQASREYRGELRIANVGLICPSILARLISTFHERFPKIEVSILQQNNFTWIEAVQKRAEIGIGYLPTELTTRTVGALSRLIVATAPVGRRGGDERLSPRDQASRLCLRTLSYSRSKIRPGLPGVDPLNFPSDGLRASEDHPGG